MKSVMPRGTRIDVLHVAKSRVLFDMQNMRMTADQNLWWVGLQKGQHSSVIATGTTGDMRHPDINALAVKSQVQRESHLNFVVINVSKDATNDRKMIE